ncbi:MAG: LytTR family DNA-binding domain-containing protein [Clostridia bacterium]|nr:LytTR family DNA-binding domain-containing protein [Clostridia bacterium]
MRYRFAVVDDDRRSLPLLKNAVCAQCERRGIPCDVESFDAAKALIEAVRIAPFDALFLDIDMPDMDGIALSDTLRGRGSNSLIVFVSAREDRVFESFRVNPLWFVRKSHLNKDLYDAVRAIWEKMQAAACEKLRLNTPDGIVNVAVDDIMWVESFGKHQTLVLSRGTFDVLHTLRELTQKLTPYGFLLVHRCYIVNCRYIFSIDSGRIVMDNHKEIPVSRYRLAQCKEAFRRSMGNGLDIEQHGDEEDI